MIVRRIKNADEFSLAYTIRCEVFVKEQGVPIEIEQDEYDKDAIHVIAFADNNPIGCGRLYINEDVGKLGRVAVLKEYRKTGAGREICKELIKIAKQSRINKIILHSQVSAVGFYEKLGFTKEGEPFTEAGIEHIGMFMEL